jgi:hypothetical protein
MNSIRAILLAGLIGLTGCTTAQVTTFIGDVQADAALVCKFVPTVATVLSFFNAAIGATVSTVTAAICAAVPPPTSARYLGLPRLSVGGAPGTVGYVGNTPIQGWRTQ